MNTLAALRNVLILCVAAAGMTACASDNDDLDQYINEIKAKPGYNPDTKEQDIAEAVKRMDAAGYPGGAGISFKNQPSQA